MASSSRFLDAATVVVSVCALVVTVLLVKREFFPPASLSGMPLPVPQEDWQAFAEGGNVLGDPNAAVTIVEFADFECPFCRRFHQYADSLARIGVPVRIVYRHYPITGHRFALPAARASECAASQGRFREMHAALFAHSDSFGVVGWDWFANRAGVSDTNAFLECVRSSAKLAALEADTLAAASLGITGTPLLLFNGWRLNGLPHFDSLRVYIERSTKR